MLKRKSTIALLSAVIFMLLLIPVWYTILIPFLVGSGLEQIDSIAIMEGRGSGWAFGRAFTNPAPLLITAHAYTAGVRANNVIMNVEVVFTQTDENKTLADFSGNSTYVFNKITRQNVPAAPEADKNRTGYNPMYPPHLKAYEAIPNVWSDNLNSTVTLEFKGIVVEEGVTLHRYFSNNTVSKEMDLPIGKRNCTLKHTSTILVEPLFGAPAYTENETFSLIAYYNHPDLGLVVQPYIYMLTFKDTNATKAQGLANAKMAFEGAQLLELYIPAIFAAIAIILATGLAFNIRRLRARVREPRSPETASEKPEETDSMPLH